MCTYYDFLWIRPRTTDIQRELFFKNSKVLGLGRQIGLKFWGAFWLFPAKLLALWVPCSWESVAGSFSYKKCWFLSLKHITPKYSQNKILAVKNLEKSLRTSVFGDPIQNLGGGNQPIGQEIACHFLKWASFLHSNFMSFFVQTFLNVPKCFLEI